MPDSEGKPLEPFDFGDMSKEESLGSMRIDTDGSHPLPRHIFDETLAVRAVARSVSRSQDNTEE